MVPSGWSEGRVKDLVESLDAGVSVNSEDDGNTLADFKILKTSSVSKGIFDSTKTKSVVQCIEVSRLKEPVLANTIIISRMNTPVLVGANGYIEKSIENTFLPDRLWQAKPKCKSVHMRWLCYWFSSSHTRYALSATATGTSGSMKNITKPDVLNIKVDIPPLSEQRKIAHILGTWDKAISTTERLIDNSKQQKKALMQQLLTGEKRLFDDSGKPFDGDWETAPLKKCVTFLNGIRKPIKKEDRADIQGEYPYYGATGVIDYVNDYLFDDELILLGEDGENILSRALPHVFTISGKSWINNHAHVMKANEDKDTYFLCMYLESLDYKKYNSGSAQPKINKAVCEKISVRFPAIKEQKKITSVLTNADKEIELLKQQLADLKQEKKALMQQLLTGKRRVKVKEMEVA